MVRTHTPEISNAPPPMAVEFFVLERERDAWATIRGFVYQVDVSITRWLELGDQDALELEAGEDIDCVSRALVGEAEAVKRLLEQVKHRDANITLRSSASREAVANFYEHRRLNPHLMLSFRFTTTAVVGREHDSPLPGKMPGIHAWKAIQQAKLQTAERDAVLKGLRQLLATPTPPSDFSDAVWQRFQSWLRAAPTTEFETFIARFEWAIASAESASLGDRIRARLQTLGYAASDDESVRIYERLFARIFTLLSSEGAKRLTRGDLAAAAASAEAPELILLGRLRALHALLAGRVESLEDRVVALTTEVAETVTSFASLSTRVLHTELGLEPVMNRG